MVPLVTFGAHARAKVARSHCPKGGLAKRVEESALNQGINPWESAFEDGGHPHLAGYIGGLALLNTPMW